jgi:hypothetical protein
MRGIDLPRGSIVEADVVTWEVDYRDGRVLRETEGARYKDIDRGQLKVFKLVKAGEVLLEAFPPPGATGANLVYRRRTTQSLLDGSRRVIFLIAYAPTGPAIMVDPAAGTYRTERAFIAGDPDMYPVELLPDEGEKLLLDYASSAK